MKQKLIQPTNTRGARYGFLCIQFVLLLLSPTFQLISLSTRFQEMQQMEVAFSSFVMQKLLLALLVSSCLAGIIVWIGQWMLPDYMHGKRKRVFVRQWILFFTGSLLGLVVRLNDLLTG